MIMFFRLFILMILTMTFTAAVATERGLSTPSYQLPASVNPRKVLELEFFASQFNSNGYYDHRGHYHNFEGPTSFKKLDSGGNVRYSWTDKVEFRAGGRYRENYSTESDGTRKVRTGFESYWGGIKYAFDGIQRWYYALDFRYRQTPYKNVNYSSSENLSEEQLVLGDSGNEVTLGMRISYLRNLNNIFSGYIAYNRPPNNLSPEILYTFEGALRYTRWAFLAGIEGIYSLGMDEYGDVEGRRVQSTGVSYLYNSIEREKIAPFLGINYGLSSTRFGLRGSYVARGNSTDQGYELKALVSWRSKGRPLEDKRIKKFKEYLVSASVLKISPSKKFVKIDKGMTGDVYKGMRIDIYRSDYFVTNVLIASGVVYEVSADWAIVKLLKKYRDEEIKKDFVARGY